MILWGKEHEARAENLAAAVNEEFRELSGMVAEPATIPKSSDATITIWGHGGPDTLADMSGEKLANFIKAWKQKNASLTTVELVTCDARHSPADNDNRDTYTDKLMPYLISSADKVLVKVKALPRGGSRATTSILYALEPKKNPDGSTVKGAKADGYYFIAGDDEDARLAGEKVFKDALAAVPGGTAVMAVMPTAVRIAKAVNDKDAMKRPLKYVASGGNYAALRGFLADVTVYIVNGNRLAVPKKLA